MRRALLLLLGLAAGALTSGVAVGILIPMLPERWRSEGLVWGSAALLLGAGTAAALVISRPRRE